MTSPDFDFEFSINWLDRDAMTDAMAISDAKRYLGALCKRSGLIRAVRDTQMTRILVDAFHEGGAPRDVCNALHQIYIAAGRSELLLETVIDSEVQASTSSSSVFRGNGPRCKLMSSFGERHAARVARALSRELGAYLDSPSESKEGSPSAWAGRVADVFTPEGGSPDPYFEYGLKYLCKEVRQKYKRNGHRLALGFVFIP